jgi:hypothetical protein
MTPAPRNRLSPCFINKSTTPIQGCKNNEKRTKFAESNNTDTRKLKGKETIQPYKVEQLSGWTGHINHTARRSFSMSSSRSLSRCLLSRYHTTKTQRILTSSQMPVSERYAQLQSCCA